MDLIQRMNIFLLKFRRNRFPLAAAKRRFRSLWCGRSGYPHAHARYPDTKPGLPTPKLFFNQEIPTERT
jgi:hypothetical protein